MGMFDSFYEADGTEWQTKAYENQLAAYHAGDTVPPLEIHPQVTDYQVEIYGSPSGKYEESFATVIGGKIHQINTPRDTRYPLADYTGFISPENGDTN